MREEKPFVLNILNREYTVQCEDGQREDLAEAAKYLTWQLVRIGSLRAHDRAYLSVALSTAFDHVQARRVRERCQTKVRSLSRRIDTALEAANS
ncbi:MAG: cell division protein ZapA [Gammaproteobacteria bacterium]|nr:cell division protein ZapA [Gammaproteobacteria bacterium]MCY4199022.1 cell division protein ZapA [Gammaproteobacteria bacterium]MCY4277759.1 cell division protein ZapA [Gammaproteobacteria bacterium]MCY4322212.1 cell division protein ZapA [Gammaproteobacteria bacterium]